jgi:hypothetical protein
MKQNVNGRRGVAVAHRKVVFVVSIKVEQFDFDQIINVAKCLLDNAKY